MTKYRAAEIKKPGYIAGRVFKNQKVALTVYEEDTQASIFLFSDMAQSHRRIALFR